MTFENCLKKSLQGLQEGATFEVYDIRSNLYQCPKPLIKQHEGETFCRHCLILVSTEKKGFLCGLESYEYVLKKDGEKDQHIVYISKVDTTSPFRGLTGRIVQSYISSLPAGSSIYVFARAQPQYLFAESADNQAKAVLSDRDLVSWWLHVLNKVPEKSSGWWSVPGLDDESSALIEIGARKRSWKASDHINWKYGTSYDPHSKADLVIPRFEDDAKSRLLKSSVTEENLSVKDFWNLLAFGEECGSGKIAGFFQLEKEDDGTTSRDNTPDLKNKDFTLFWNKFMSLDFSNDEAITKSTNIAKSDINEIFPNLKPIQITVNTKTKDDTNIINAEKRPAINMLSGSFIKRKKI
ncbi:H3 K56 histone acetylation protein RTT109 [Mucor mucedo]|uniref:H3 K56 histone acetylation protein RTT109 n=1 Tax=Mucor mucedo TaxID=29922 RepID=UPI00221E63D7|nr:H3 K56 histone acetylation protein RTT109 [Mucor mucedo]KAI7895832.1 H3 K56 histone acetylation protein RTT109 [Mucor mucedo]